MNLRASLAVLGAILACSPLARAGTFKVLHTFCTTETKCRSGIGPEQLVTDQAGNIFGTTSQKGAYHGRGTIFEITAGPHFRVLHTFCEHPRESLCADGAIPRSPLILDANGNLFGVTGSGGAYDGGTAFELSPNADRTVWTLTTLYSFCGPGDPVCANGAGVRAGLTYAGDSNGLPWDGISPLYTVISGSSNAPGHAGGVIRLTPGTPWTGALLYAFCQQGGNACADGAIPDFTPAIDDSGNIFGITTTGGTAGGGTVFELTPGASDGWSETVLHSFCASGPPLCADGASPDGPVTLDAEGNVFGTTIRGGQDCQGAAFGGQTCGVLYKVVPGNSTETVLHTFCGQSDCVDGAWPLGRIAIDSMGRLFGSAESGGSNIGIEPTGPGILFRLDNSGFTVLHNFCALADCADGQEPQTGPVIAPNGSLYGSTEITVYRSHR